MGLEHFFKATNKSLIPQAVTIETMVTYVVNLPPRLHYHITLSYMKYRNVTTVYTWQLLNTLALSFSKNSTKLLI